MVSEGPKQAQIEANICVSDLGGFQAENSDVVVGYTSKYNGKCS